MQYFAIMLFFISTTVWAQTQIPATYVFGKKAQGWESYILVLGERTFEINLVQGRIHATDPNIPQKLLPELQLIIDVNHVSGEIDLNSIFDQARSHDASISIQYLQFKLLNICFESKRSRCVANIFAAEFSPQITGLAAAYLGHLAESYLDKVYYYQLARKWAPQDDNVLREIQIFNLLTAESVLKHHQQLLNQNGIWKKLGMTPSENAPPAEEDFWDSCYESFLNTAHSLAIVFTDYEEDLLDVWSEQLKQTSDLKMAIHMLRNEMEQAHLSLNKLNLENKRHLRDLYASSMIFLHSDFGKSLLKGEMLLNNQDHALLPTPDLMGVDTEIDFVNWSWPTFVVTQVNILNVYMVFRGEAMLMEMARTKQAQWIAGTSVGQLVGSKLGIAAIQARITNWPEGARKFFMWFMADMVLDGCLLRYAYIAYSAAIADDNTQQGF